STYPGAGWRGRARYVRTYTPMAVESPSRRRPSQAQSPVENRFEATAEGSPVSPAESRSRCLDPPTLARILLQRDVPDVSAGQGPGLTYPPGRPPSDRGDPRRLDRLGSPRSLGG